MDRANQPTKEDVRAWLQQRSSRPVPLPSGEQIRRQLGWSHSESAANEFQSFEIPSLDQA